MWTPSSQKPCQECSQIESHIETTDGSFLATAKNVFVFQLLILRFQEKVALLSSYYLKGNVSPLSMHAENTA